MRNSLTLVLDNVRSAQNVGAILRTADAAGVAAVWLCGLTPTPELPGDPRPPYVQTRNRQMLAKTALGAETTLSLTYSPTTAEAVSSLRAAGCTIAALELSSAARNLFTYSPTGPLALVVGHETEGVDDTALDQCDVVLQIPMRGSKESLNVAVAAGIAMYHLLKD